MYDIQYLCTHAALYIKFTECGHKLNSVVYGRQLWADTGWVTGLEFTLTRCSELGSCCALFTGRNGIYPVIHLFEMCPS